MGNCCSTGEHKHHGKEKPTTKNQKVAEKRLEVHEGMQESKEQDKENIPPVDQKGTFQFSDKKSENRINNQNLPPSIGTPTLPTDAKIGPESEVKPYKKNGIEITPPKLKTNKEKEDETKYSKKEEYGKDTLNVEGRALEIDATQHTHPEVVITTTSPIAHKQSDNDSSLSESERIPRKRKEKLEVEPVVQDVEEVKEVIIKNERIQKSESEDYSPGERYGRVEMPVKKEAIKQPETIIPVARKDSPKLQTSGNMHTTTFKSEQVTSGQPMYDEQHIQTIAELKTPEVKTVPTPPHVDFSNFERENSVDSSEEDRKKHKSWKFLKRPKVLEEEQKQIGFTVSKNEIINEREYSPAGFKTPQEKLELESKKDKSQGLVLKKSSSSYSSSDEDIGIIRTVDKLPHMNRRILGEIQNYSNLKESVIESRVIYPVSNSSNDTDKSKYVRVPDNTPQTEKMEITSPRYIKRQISSSSSSSPIKETISPRPASKTHEPKDTTNNKKPEVNYRVKKWSELKQKVSSSSESDSDFSPVKSPSKVPIISKAKSPSKNETKLNQKLLKNHTPTFKPETNEPKLTQARRPLPGKVEISPIYNKRDAKV